MNKLATFIERNQGRMTEDAEVRAGPAGPPKPTKLDGRVRLQNAAAIALDRIVADAQHRESFDEGELQRLAASLKEEGQLQPARVYYDESRGVYVLIAGERRWRAAKLAGLATLDCVVAEGQPDAKSILRAQVVENALREDLKPVEKARAFKAVMDLEGLDGKGLAERLHIDPSTVSRALALLKLDDDTQARVDAGTVAPTVAIRQVQKTIARGDGKPAGRRAGKPAAKERVFRLAGGVTVTVAARRTLTDNEVTAALSEALGQGRAGRAA